MSLRPLYVSIILSTVFSICTTGCSSPPWRKKQSAIADSTDAYYEQVATEAQYDSAPGDASEYQRPPESESTYIPASSVSRSQSSGSGSCCH
jgi:hypothetical protein